MSARRPARLIGALLASACLSAPASHAFNVNPDAFTRSLPAEDQRRLNDPNRASLFDAMRDDMNQGGGGGRNSRNNENPVQFFNRYMKCDEVRAGYNRTDACYSVYTKYCGLFRALPEEIRANVAQKVDCQANGDTDPTFDGGMGAPAQYNCASTDARTLALLRKYYGKEEEVRSLIFFVDRMSRDLNSCTRGG